MGDYTLSSVLQRYGMTPGPAPEPTMMGRFLKEGYGVLPTSEMPTAEKHPDWFNKGAGAVEQAMMGLRMHPNVATGTIVVPRGMDPAKSGAYGYPDHIGATPSAETLARFAPPSTPGKSTWPGRPMGPLEPANANAPADMIQPYTKPLDPNVARFRAALEGYDYPPRVNLRLIENPNPKN